jgi:hypothetical protein
LREEESFKDSDWNDEIFLVADSKSVASFYPMSEAVQSTRPHGDYCGFVTAVEANFDPEDPGDHAAEEAPGFTGQMRILISLIFSDLWALAKAQAAFPEDLWVLAMHHPWQVYVGPVVSKQKKLWVATTKDADHGETAHFRSLMPDANANPGST